MVRLINRLVVYGTCVAITTVVSACATAPQVRPQSAYSHGVRFLATNPFPHVAVPLLPEQVEVHTVQPPSRDFVDVGVLAFTDSAFRNISPTRETEVTEILRKAAAERGCGSIVLQGFYDTNFEGAFALADARTYRATCIVYLEERKAAVPPTRAK